MAIVRPQLMTPVGPAVLPGDGGSAHPAALDRARVDGKFLCRGGKKLRVQGVTYGPFASDAAGDAFPPKARVDDDFGRMRDIGVNAIRTYHVPPAWLLESAAEHGIGVLIDVPWPKHGCYLESQAAGAEARRAVREAARRGRAHSSVLAYSIGNEIRPDIVRWHGVRRVERHLAELRDVAKQADPDGLVTYASYPPTEYLDSSLFDFATFNVYLHDREAFVRYLFRLQNLVGDKPLILGELGMDTLRHGESEQVDFLHGHLREALLMGASGAFVFSWTDDWYTGGHPIEDWAFGITHVDRSPKAAYHALRELFESPIAALLPERPRVSVVVCSYNGGRTLEQCLRSLLALDYPDYEVILVDDGSTDQTREIAARYSTVRAIHQPNLGLSQARNVGLWAATGEVIAYTDSDCYADRDWLTHLVYQLERSGAAAVGGPNLSPEDGWMGACVAASMGHPTHVLESDQVAEHIPGCNMAFRRQALEAINGFDPVYRKAGDDVDVCWRLQHAGYWITFAPGAFVWHHRRQSPRAYLRQQAGYGEAEALLHFKHPEKFNGWGDGKWQGVMYGDSLRGLRVGGPIIYRGVFGTGLFQCLYRPAPAHWLMLPSTLEWHAAAAAVALGSWLWPWGLTSALLMLGLSPAVAVLSALQARLNPTHDGVRARLLVAALCYTQPLVRSWARYRKRLFSRRVPRDDPGLGAAPGRRIVWTGRARVAYWSEDGRDRTELLREALAFMARRRWGRVLDSGWCDWDVRVFCHTGLTLKVTTAQEEHGSGRRLVRVRYRLAPTASARLGAGLVALVVTTSAMIGKPAPAAALAGLAALGAAVVWVRALLRATRVMALFDVTASRLGMVPCEPRDSGGMALTIRAGTEGAHRAPDFVSQVRKES